MHRFFLSIVVLVAFCSLQIVSADSTDVWLEARQTSTEALLDILEAPANQSEIALVRLVLADRAINQSIDKFAGHLEAAEPLIAPDTDAGTFATALRCQLEHRQGNRRRRKPALRWLITKGNRTTMLCKPIGT